MIACPVITSVLGLGSLSVRAASVTKAALMFRPHEHNYPAGRWRASWTRSGRRSAPATRRSASGRRRPGTRRRAAAAVSQRSPPPAAPAKVPPCRARAADSRPRLTHQRRLPSESPAVASSGRTVKTCGGLAHVTATKFCSFCVPAISQTVAGTGTAFAATTVSHRMQSQ